MKLSFVWPSAEFSTFDCATGIRQGLINQGVEIVDFRLYQRIKFASLALQATCPPDQIIDIQNACLFASEALPYIAITKGTPWALIVSGMGIHPNALWAIRSIGVKIACWFTESPYDSDTDHELYLAKFCDIAFVNERTAVEQFEKILKENTGGIARYFPHAYNPEIHKPGEPDLDHLCDVIFIGTGFTERQVLLEAIDWSGIDLRLGGQWPGILHPNCLESHVAYPCISNEDTIKLYRSAKIVLNPHRYAEGAESCNPRVYEAAACKSFQISDYRAEIKDLFGDAIPMYEPGVPWQLATLIRYYLSHDKERNSLAQKAYDMVQGQTFDERAKFIIQTIQEYSSGQRLKLVHSIV